MQMATSKSIYLGDLRTKCIHLKSNSEILTDAPTDNHGKGEAFSPTDLVATALGACMLTTMAIVGERENIDLKGVGMEIKKVMTTEPPRAISEIHISFNFNDIYLNENQQIKLKNTALTCPVSLSLDPEIKQIIDFNFN